MLPVVRRSGSAPAFTVKNTPPAAVHRIRSGFRPCGSRRKGLLRLTARMRLHDHGVGIPSVLESLSSRASLPRMARAFRIKRQSCARTASRAASEAVAKSFYTFAFCTADLLRSCCSVIHPFPACHRNQNHVKWRHQTSEQNTLVAHCRH